jgi:hypothetical protein
MTPFLEEEVGEVCLWMSMVFSHHWNNEQAEGEKINRSESASDLNHTHTRAHTQTQTNK